MQLTENDLTFIERVVRTAISMDIESIIIEPNKVRAVDNKKTVVIFSELDNKTSFGTLGLNKLGQFIATYDTVSVEDNFLAQAIMEDEFVRGIKMTSTNSTSEYRCANPAAITAPHVINDLMIYQFELTPEAFSTLQKIGTSLGAEQVQFIGDENGVRFELASTTGDTFSHNVANSYTYTERDGGTDAGFSHKYLVKTILALFKQKQDSDIYIGKRGILCYVLNGMNIYVLPQQT